MVNVGISLNAASAKIRSRSGIPRSIGIVVFLMTAILWHQSVAANSTLRISNRVHADQYINIENGRLESAVIPASAQSSYWTVEPVAGTAYIMLRNYWGRDQLINVETGTLQSSVIHVQALSAHWSIEPVAGTRFVRLRNRWKSDQYMQIEGGRLIAAPALPTFAASHWLMGEGQSASGTFAGDAPPLSSSTSPEQC